MKNVTWITAFIHAHGPDLELVAVSLHSQSIDAHVAGKLVLFAVVTRLLFLVVVIRGTAKWHIGLAVDERHFVANECRV